MKGNENSKREEQNEILSQAIKEEQQTQKKSEIENSQDKRLKNSSFIDSWKNATDGIIYTVTTQGNIKRQLLIAAIVVIASLFFNLSKAEFLCLIFTIILILFAEMVNTAIESVVDLYVDVYHPKAKIAKDVAAGGVVITAINAIIVAYFLFFDKLADIGLNFIENVAKTPSHLAFSVMIIVVIAALALISFAKTNKHKGLNNKFIPSGHAIISFAANAIIWTLADNSVILMLSLIMAILVSESRIAAKEHKLSEIVFSSAIGTLLVLIAYALVMAGVNL